MAQQLQPVTVTASVTVNKDTHEGNVVRLSAAAGLTVTLPASSGKGDVYSFFVLTTVTSNNYIIAVANSTDVMQGGLALSTDVAGVTMLASGTSDTITMNGSTKGGLIGSHVTLRDVAAGFWQVSGFMVCTGAEADPFSAAVS